MANVNPNAGAHNGQVPDLDEKVEQDARDHLNKYRYMGYLMALIMILVFIISLSVELSISHLYWYNWFFICFAATMAILTAIVWFGMRFTQTYSFDEIDPDDKDENLCRICTGTSKDQHTLEVCTCSRQICRTCFRELLLLLDNRLYAEDYDLSRWPTCPECHTLFDIDMHWTFEHYLYHSNKSFMLYIRDTCAGPVLSFVLWLVIWLIFHDPTNIDSVLWGIFVVRLDIFFYVLILLGLSWVIALYRLGCYQREEYEKPNPRTWYERWVRWFENFLRKTRYNVPRSNAIWYEPEQEV